MQLHLLMRIITPKFFLAFVFFSLVKSSIIYGQQAIHGKIANSRTRDVIQYANIGIAGANIGTISNPDGSFALSIPGKWLNDSITFSSIGYYTKSIAITSLLLQQDPVIYMDEKLIELRPVIVSNKKNEIQTIQLGNSQFNGGVLETDTVYAGRSIALLIDNKEPGNKSDTQFSAYLENARLRILRNNLPSFKFRVRIASVDPLTGKPGEDLLSKSIIEESSIRKGWLKFDLSKLNMEVHEPFFLIFEQLLDISDRAAIADDYRKFEMRYPDKIKIDTIEIDGRKEFRKKITGSHKLDLAGTYIAIWSSSTAASRFTSFVKETSLGEWKKVAGIVAATITLSK